MTYTDEILSAYLDGELSDAQRIELDAAVISDLDLKRRLEKLSAVDEYFHQAMDSLAGDDMPDAVLSLLEGPVQTRFQKSGLAPRWIYPLAACFLMIAATGIGYNFGEARSSNQIDLFASKITASSPLYPILETTPSARQISVDKAGNTKMEILLSFASFEGQYCRQFNLEQSGTAFDALACRDETTWHVIAMGLARPQDANIYRTASTQSSPAVEAAVDALIEADAFSPDQEANLIQTQWSTTKP